VLRGLLRVCGGLLLGGIDWRRMEDGGWERKDGRILQFTVDAAYHFSRKSTITSPPKLQSHRQIIINKCL
jgi:hypothetical protein